MINGYRLVSIKEIESKATLKNFDCDVEALNDFLSRYAKKNDELGIGKTFVALDENNQIAGYFTLATAQVSYNEVSEDYKRKLPKYPIPALRIARLAVNKKFQGKGVGKWLLKQSFLKIIQVSEVTGLHIIIVDAKENSKTFYEHYGFTKFMDKELSYFILLDTVKKAIMSSSCNNDAETKTMTDFHVHFGQWGEKYFDAKGVFTELKNRDFDEIYFSSTTSCRYCKESFAVQNDKNLQKDLISARELYELVRFEIQEALIDAKNLNIVANPLYWVVPEIHLSNATTVKDAMNEICYKGFKIHPRANYWDLSDEKITNLAEEIFAYADKHKMLVLIHCGEDEFELPTKFEKFIAKYKNCTVQLAHSRPLEQTLYMLEKYPNTVCDTAFASDNVIEEIKQSGFENRIRYGSDFPICK